MHKTLSLWPLSMGEGGSVKFAVAQGAFAPPNLFVSAGRAKQGLQRLMKEAAGSSYKKRDWRKSACVAWQNKS